MTIPTSGPYTSATIKNEWGFSLPFTSAQVASAAGLSAPWTSEQLRGKSSFSVTFNIGAQTSSMGGPIANRFMNFRREITVIVNGGTGYTYQWAFHSAAYGNSGLSNINSATCLLQSTDFINDWEDGGGYDEVVLKVTLSGGTTGNGTYYTPLIYIG